MGEEVLQLDNVAEPDVRGHDWVGLVTIGKDPWRIPLAVALLSRCALWPEGRPIAVEFRRRDDAVAVEVHHRELPPGIGEKFLTIDTFVSIGVGAGEPCRQSIRACRAAQRAAVEDFPIGAVDE